MFVYFVLFFLLHWGYYRSTKRKNTLEAWVIPLSLCFAYALSDELHQSFVPGRTATVRDIGYDSLGMTIALLRQYGYI